MVDATASAATLATAVAAKEVSSVELLDRYLDRIDRLGTDVNAVVTIDAERAREACAAADDAVVAGATLGPLHGLPVTIKDALEVEGIRSTGGAAALRDHVPTVDAPAVARLRAAGAIVFGKTNVPEWSGDFQTYNDLFGTTSNPWDLARTPGGSSGGPAAAVACGFTAFEVGTDIGGSIRVPSHFCGTWGLKPTHGVISQRGYLDFAGGGTTDADINVLGPMARSAADLDLLLGVLAGPDDDRAVAWRLDLPTSTIDDLRGLRVGTWFDEADHPVDPEYRAVLDRTVAALESAGAHVEAAHPAVDLADQLACFDHLIAAAVCRSWPEAMAEAVGGSHLAWLEADRHRAALQARWAEWFTTHDVLLCPVTPTAAFTHRQEGSVLDRTIDVAGVARPYLANIAWAGLVGVVGHPATVPPLGRTASGLPVGVQVVAPRFGDRTAIRVAELLAEATDGAGYVPPPGFEG